MKFHGRLGPGRLTDAGQVLELRLHAPARAAGLTIKIWEMDTFPDEQGGTTSEGSEDDLLATFTGDLETAPGALQIHWAIDEWQPGNNLRSRRIRQARPPGAIADAAGDSQQPKIAHGPFDSVDDGLRTVVRHVGRREAEMETRRVAHSGVTG